MDCHVSRERLWSWVDRDAPELEEHVASCATCRRRTEVIRSKIRVIAAGSSVVLPERVGPYTVQGLLGEGGQALVYEAVQPEPRRTVALKVLKGGRFASEKLVEHFRRESQALADLQHEGIATIFEAGCTEEGLHYFAMERVDGVPLDRFLRERNPGHEDRLELFGRICAAAAFAHKRGVVHRDLKPSNIIVDDEGRPKILDFGLARMIRQDAGAGHSGTRTGLLAGTPRYMSPEQARGSTASADPRSDVYSLGVILYEILTGRPPHDVRDLTPDSLRILLEEPPARPSRLDRTVSGELDAVVLKALDKDRARRYPSAAGLCEDLRRLRDSEPVLARPPSLPYRLRKRLYRHRRNAAMALAAAAVLAALGHVAHRPPPSSQPTFDLDSARVELLEIRRDLLRGDPGHAAASRAAEIGRIYPGIPEAVLLRAQAICLTEGPQIAVPWLTVHASEPSEHWSFHVLLDEIRRDDPYKSAIRVSNRGTADVDPESAESWYLRSFATLDVQRALERAAQAERRDPSFRPALATLALLSPLAGDVEGALAWAGKLEGMDLRERSSSRWSGYRIELLFGQERFEEARAECDRLVARSGPGSRGVIQRARVLRRMGRYEEAVRDLTRAIEARGPQTARSTWLYYHRGTMLWMLGRDREAIEDYTRVYRSLTYASYANVRLFFILHERGNAAAADRMLAEARDRVSNDPWLAAILSSLAGERTPEQLIAAASDPVERCEALYYAGEISLLRGRRPDAVRWFRECVATGIDRDPAEFWEPLSEFELARWRLERLEPSVRPTDPSAGS